MGDNHSNNQHNRQGHWAHLTLGEIDRSPYFKPGSCIVCGNGTDTGVTAVGSAEWITAFYMMLTGDPINVAVEVVPAVDGQMTFRCCGTCARLEPVTNRPRRQPLQVALIGTKRVPGYMQPAL